MYHQQPVPSNTDHHNIHERTNKMSSSQKSIDDLKQLVADTEALIKLFELVEGATGTRKPVQANSTTSNGSSTTKVPKGVTKITKDIREFMPAEQEIALVMECVEELIQQWGANPKLSEKFPIMVGCGILVGLGTSPGLMGVDVFRKQILGMMDKARSTIVENHSRTLKGHDSCH
jgi:hypothetical protein